MATAQEENWNLDEGEWLFALAGSIQWSVGSIQKSTDFFYNPQPEYDEHYGQEDSTIVYYEMSTKKYPLFKMNFFLLKQTDWLLLKKVVFKLHLYRD